MAAATFLPLESRWLGGRSPIAGSPYFYEAATVLACEARGRST